MLRGYRQLEQCSVRGRWVSIYTKLDSSLCCVSWFSYINKQLNLLILNKLVKKKGTGTWGQGKWMLPSLIFLVTFLIFSHSLLTYCVPFCSISTVCCLSNAENPSWKDSFLIFSCSSSYLFWHHQPFPAEAPSFDWSYSLSSLNLSTTVLHTVSLVLLTFMLKRQAVNHS